MIVDKISILKYRGFENVDFQLGLNITAISGLNGTQKTTILGMLSQPFSITDDENPMKNEKPLCGGTYKSDFSNKFKFSAEFDKAGLHEWTLHFKDESTPSYTVESISRDAKAGTIRFWKKGNREKGSGYIQLPVIYLSLKRLLPIAEDNTLAENSEVTLSAEEFTFYQEWFNKILILTRDKEKVTSYKYLSSTHKQTLGANTDHYDWKVNSAGQDNVSKILLAILSFKRLLKKYPEDYKGGILAIDEIDATLYPGSQIKLIEALIKFSSQFKIQVIFTTHSLTILKEISKFKDEKHRKDQIKLMFLAKEDGKVDVKNDVEYDFIKNHLNRVVTGKSQTTKINVYTEDREGITFAKYLLGTKTRNLNFINIPLGCSNLIQLSTAKLPPFIFPNSIIILDGDVKSDPTLFKKVKSMKNILLLPSNKSPEQLLSDFLDSKQDSDPIWKKMDVSFDHGVCFGTYSYDEVQTKREKAKKWFNEHLNLWGVNASKVLKFWKAENNDLVDEFNSNFVKLFSELKKNK